jgi:uncharacterized protein
MMNFRRLKMKSVLILTLLLSSANAFAQVHTGKAIPPPPSSYIYYETDTLSPQFRRFMFKRLANEDQTNGNQVLIAFFNSIEGEDVVDYTNRVFTSWHPGQKGKNNGLLIAAFLKEHQVRIEVGYGLEPFITDAKSKDVILNDLTPEFKAGEYEKGIDQAVTHLLSIIHQGQGIADPVAGANAGDATDVNVQGRSLPLGNVIIFAFILFLVLRPAMRVVLLMLFPSMAAWFLFELLFGGPTSRGGGIFFGGGGGGFGGGGFGGGGGFSGGGGMSGGGGASGSW